MELAIRIQIEELPEGLFLATSDELLGLVAQGRTVEGPVASSSTAKPPAATKSGSIRRRTLYNGSEPPGRRA